MRRALSIFCSQLAVYFAALAFTLICPQPGMAGAWPRTKGDGFLASASRITATTQDGPYGVYSTAYFEYGIGRDYTAGADFGRGISGKTKSILFLRAAPFGLQGGHLFALEIGVGEIAGAATLRPGLSYGHGFSGASGIIGALSNGSGWASVETYAEINLTNGRTDFKADFTLGLNHGARLKSIVQLQTGKSRGDPLFMRLAPSIVIKAGKLGQIELGATADIAGGHQLGLKLGLWQDF
ncbi:hypothetical protein U5922_009140 [Aquicoccus sp. G2-2]|uniref:hypothetical protein n=1 Tax=Aquicoccus sp. G2-2 TaxID=3092120 RepID=UPI002AE04435|nr:hypothetical protein [Aquicoccus sp. G2-2]MEA1113635.1 hypothetical protein [Aquicoccus sp. G2-2]